jgi:hypothetical protein
MAVETTEGLIEAAPVDTTMGRPLVGERLRVQHHSVAGRDAVFLEH